MTTALTTSATLERPPAPGPPALAAREPEGLPEFRLYSPRVGHPDWPTLAREAAEIAAQVLPKLERPERPSALLRRKLRSYRTAAGNYLDNRRRARQGREDFRPLYFIWTVLRTCNFLCTYCDDHQGRKYPELPNNGVLNTEQGLRLLSIMRNRTPSVYFAGGEPTLRKDLPVLTREARDLGYFPIIINTNGSAVDRLVRLPAWRTWLADTDVVVVSLDAVDLSELRDMWVYDRPADVLRNLLLLRELSGPMRFKLMVNTVIQPGKYDHARDVLDLAADLGIWFCPVPMNTGPTIHRGLTEDPGYRDLADLILARKRAGQRISGSERMNRRLLRSEKLVCRNTVKPHIDYDGALIWPCKASINVAPEHVNVLDYPDVDALYDAASKLVDPTRFHGPAKNQCGANCNWAQNYTTDTYANGLVHPFSLLQDVAGFLRS